MSPDIQIGGTNVRLTTEGEDGTRSWRLPNIIEEARGLAFSAVLTFD
jgi:hypothetical protein